MRKCIFRLDKVIIKVYNKSCMKIPIIVNVKINLSFIVIEQIT